AGAPEQPTPPAQPPTMADAASGQELASLQSKLDLLAVENARRGADLAAASLKIAERERKGGRGEAGAGPGAACGRPAELESQLYAAQAKLDALRQALAQAHESQRGEANKLDAS